MSGTGRRGSSSRSTITPWCPNGRAGSCCPRLSSSSPRRTSSISRPPCGSTDESAKIRPMDAELAGALDDLILGRGVARGRHSLRHQGRLVRNEFEERLLANGFRPMTVRAAPIEAGEKIPAFHIDKETVDFGYIRWEILTPKRRRKLSASQRRRPDNQEWAVQLNLASPENVWPSPERK